jgi:hypothetical protein
MWEQASGVLQELLHRQKDGILERWLDLILESFPSDSHQFFKLESNQFSNPVGHTFREETKPLLQALIDRSPIEDLQEPLHRIVRIRAVQDCPPSDGIVFVFLLKRAIRETLSAAAAEYDERDLGWLDQEIDRLAMAAFDEYMKCRERIYEIRMRADKMRTAKLVERLTVADDNRATDSTTPGTGRGDD